MAALSTVTLTVLMGPVAVAPAPRAVVDALDGATVTHAVGTRSGFQLSLTYSKTSPIATSLLPAGFFDPMTRVVLVATLRGVPKVLADGPVKRQDVTATGRPGEYRLVVTGEDVSGYMDVIDLTGFPFPGMPPFAQVESMMAKYAPFGVVPTTIPAPFQPETNPVETIPHQQGTDFEYASKLAKDAGYEFYVTPGPTIGANTAYWGPQVRVGAVQPALTVDMDTAANLDSLSFSADGNATAQPHGHVQVGKFAVPVPAPDIALLKPPLSARPLMPTRTKLLETGGKKLPEVLMTLLAGRGAADPLTATGSMDLTRYGQPLGARSLIGVRGVGRAHDGLWFVRSVTHTLGRGSWKQAFQLARDGFVSNVTEVAP
ncbi:hypothetical protein C1I97_24240 [Streptomyces sp. NTH33]|uniref:hypothetical protein n=1 Tax=Streptomyces sp. NTH33 TaxID=1735453 RepID=UPI000DAA37A6|nr:hypothetical protein [Streptomyces sp. NTH33]PZG99171.1 hypothetical protein C1I97_24240 [Streptomyces sp. NTH33]